MKILIFSTDCRPLLGGIAVVAEELAKNFSKSNDVVMLAPRMKGSEYFDKKNSFKTVRALNIVFLREILFTFYLSYYIVFKGFRSVYCVVWFPCGLLTYLLSKVIKFNYYCMGHGTDFIDDNVTIKRRIKSMLSGFKIRAFNGARRSFTVSDYSKDMLVKMGVRADNLVVVPNGVDIDKYRPDEPGRDFIAKYNLQGRRVMLTVARLELYKGQDMVIKVFPRLIDKYSNLYYYIVGKGSDEDKLKKLVAERRLQERVIFTGAVSEQDILDFYKACEIFLMVSRQVGALVEGFGITFIEAAACGKVVIGGRSGGTPFAVSDGVSGVLIDPESEKELEGTLEEFLGDEGKRRRFGAQAREWIVNERTWKYSAKQILTIMQG